MTVRSSASVSPGSWSAGRTLIARSTASRRGSRVRGRGSLRRSPIRVAPRRADRAIRRQARIARENRRTYRQYTLRSPDCEGCRFDVRVDGGIERRHADEPLQHGDSSRRSAFAVVRPYRAPVDGHPFGRGRRVASRERRRHSVGREHGVGEPRLQLTQRWHRDARGSCLRQEPRLRAPQTPECRASHSISVGRAPNARDRAARRAPILPGATRAPCVSMRHGPERVEAREVDLRDGVRAASRRDSVSASKP